MGADRMRHGLRRETSELGGAGLEEAVVDFTESDGLYGSRHLAARLRSEGLVPRIKGFFLLDMIGDKDRRANDSADGRTAGAMSVVEQGIAPFDVQA